MKKRRKIIFIAGGAGFIGSYLCELFLEKDYRVICMDNLITGEMANIKHLVPNKQFEFIKQNITTFIKIPGKIDFILHFASPASPIDYLQYPIQTLKVGALGTHNCLGLAKTKKAVFCLASTSEVYGDPLVHPQKESYWGNVNPIGPRAVYDEAKRFAEAITMAYYRAHRVNTRIVRIFNTYGPRMRLNDGRAIPNFITQALKSKPLTVYGDGRQTRSFCYVSDLIQGIYKLIHSTVHDPVNIGNPAEYTLRELARLIIKMTKSNSKIIYLPLPQDDPKKRKPDIARARQYLRWAPTILLRDGLENTIAWFRYRAAF